MKMNLVLAAVALFSIPAFADTPGAHPAILHALTDLRTARWHLEHRGGSQALQDADKRVIEAIDHCIDKLKKAASDDGKNLNDHPKEDDGKDKVGHVHRARELLEKAKHDISEKESNPAAEEIRNQALHDLDEALERVNEALKIKN